MLRGMKELIHIKYLAYYMAHINTHGTVAIFSNNPCCSMLGNNSLWVSHVFACLTHTGPLCLVMDSSFKDICMKNSTRKYSVSLWVKGFMLTAYYKRFGFSNFKVPLCNAIHRMLRHTSGPIYITPMTRELTHISWYSYFLLCHE